MAIKLADTLEPMADFPAAMAEHVNIVKSDNTEKSIQAMYDDGELGGGGGITVDSELSTTSENPVQNKVITTTLNTKVENTTTDLVNYYTKDDVYDKDEIAELIGDLNSLHSEIVQALPEQDISTTTIYLILDPQSTPQNPSYNQYMYINNAWALLGTTTVNLSNYYTKTEVDDLIGDVAITKNITANITVGGISAGDTFLAGTPIQNIVEKALVTEIAPTITFSSTNSGIREEGTSVTPTMTLTISNVGTGTPVSISFYSGSTLLDTQSYVSGTNTYTYTMETAISTDTTVKGVLNYTKSDGTTSATVEKTASYTFVMASYYGTVSLAPATANEIKALNKNVKTSKGYTATYNLSYQRSCYCYPASFGNLTTIKDANNVEYIQSYTKTNVTVDGVSYNVYTLTDPVTITSFKQIFA